MVAAARIVWSLLAWQLLCHVAVGHSTSHSIAHKFPDPNNDPFYAVPQSIATCSPGDALRTRNVITTVTGQAISSFQMLFATTDAQGNASATVGTVWQPALPASPPKIFSYQFAEDSVNLDCAPSWAWVNESSPETLAGLTEASLLVPWALAQGYYVVNVDYEGPHSAWLTGKVEGQAVLDGIRAAISQLHLPREHTETVLYGYSGAAHASVWASSLSNTYAPDLTIAGAAFGGTPVDLLANYNAVNGGAQAVLAGLLLLGLSNGYPELNSTFNSRLTKNGTQTSQTMRAPGFCAVTKIETYTQFNFSTIFTGDIFTDSTVQRVFAENSLLSNDSSQPAPVPKFPTFQFQGLSDTIVPYGLAKSYVEQQCAKGADIRFISFPGLGHAQANLAGLPGALQFVKQAFEKTLSPAACGANVTVPAIGSQVAVELLGPNANIILAAEYSEAKLE